MTNLTVFKKFLRTGFVLVIAVAFTCTVTSLYARDYTPDHYSYYHADFNFIIPDVVSAPTAEPSVHIYLQNDGKPVNLHYQPVKKNQLNLIYSQRNC